MHDQASAPAVELHVDEAQLLVLALLLAAGGPAQWSVTELALELGCERQAIEAVVALRTAGLVHCCQEFVFASRGAVRFRDLLCGVDERAPAMACAADK
jgi:hypothetical protein